MKNKLDKARKEILKEWSVLKRRMAAIFLIGLIGIVYAGAWNLIGEKANENTPIFIGMNFGLLTSVIIVCYILLCRTDNSIRKQKIIVTKLSNTKIIPGIIIASVGVFFLNFWVKTGANIYSYDWKIAISTILIFSGGASIIHQYKRRQHNLSAILGFTILGVVAYFVVAGIPLIVSEITNK